MTPGSESALRLRGGGAPSTQLAKTPGYRATATKTNECALTQKEAGSRLASNCTNDGGRLYPTAPGLQYAHYGPEELETTQPDLVADSCSDLLMTTLDKPYTFQPGAKDFRVW